MICRHHFPLWNSKDTSLDLLSNLQVSFKERDFKMLAFSFLEHCIFFSETMFWVLHDLLLTVQDVHHALTFLSFRNYQESSDEKACNIVSIFPSMPASLTDEIHVYNLITMHKNIQSKFLPLRLCLLCLAVCKMFMR